MQRLVSAASRVVRILTNVGLIALTLACTAYLVPSLLGYERYVITGGSMSGSTFKGSIAFEKPVPVGELEVGRRHHLPAARGQRGEQPRHPPDRRDR